MFTFNQQEANASDQVVTDIIPVISIHARVLFDFGSSHSFISLKFAISLNCVPEKLNEPLYVSTPFKNIIVANIIFKNCIIQIEEKELAADLIQLNMYDFDVILGMNWLSSYHAHIDCFRKRVIFQISDEP